MLRRVIRILILLGGLSMMLPHNAYAQGEMYREEMLEGTIVSATSERKKDPIGEEYLYQKLSVRIDKGSKQGEVIEIVNDTVSISRNPNYKAGDRVVIMYASGVEGEDVFYITDFVRRERLIWLLGAFAVLAIVVGGKWGVTSLIGMIYTFLVIFKFVLPQILSGADAVIAAVIGASVMIPVTFSLSHGLKIKTLIAGVSTVVTLMLTGIIAAVATELTYLTGFGSEEALFLQFQLGESINMKGMLLAGMIISTLGILDDITVSQASVVAELKRVNKKLGFKTLFTSGMNVGRDHIASLINTLVLVYAGASMPLLLLFIINDSPMSEVVNIEMIAEEIVRTLVGSMALILAVPIATGLAAYYYVARDTRKG